MSRDDWRRAVRPPSKPGHYNVRVVSRARDGTLIVMDLGDVPPITWLERFSPQVNLRPAVHHLHGGVTACRMPGLPGSWPEGHKWSEDWLEVTCAECRAIEFVRRGQAAQAAVDEIIKKATPT